MMKQADVPFLRMFSVVFFLPGKRYSMLVPQSQPFWAAIGLLVALVAGDYLAVYGSNLRFDLYGLGRWTLCVAAAAGFDYLTRQYNDAYKPGVLFSLCLELLALLYLLQCMILYVAYALKAPGAIYTWLYDAFDVWLVAGLAYGCYQLGGRSVVGSVSPIVFGFLIFIMPLMLYVSYTDSFWYEARPKDDAKAVNVDVERTYYRQHDLVASQIAALAPDIAGKIDLYLVAFAPWSWQQVFWKEVSYVNKLFDQRFDTTQRRVALVNQQATLDTLPLANLPNLRSTLQGLAKKMNVEEDFLVLYLTSHGDRQGNLSAAFPSLNPHEIAAGDLKKALDDAGIRWRVIIVSACYSGRFVDALKDEYTIAASAAAKDRQSFGCGNEDEFTYFGEALFKDGVASGKSLLRSIVNAKSVVAAREKRENKTPSKPQLWVGKKMRAKLEQYEIEAAASVPVR